MLKVNNGNAMILSHKPHINYILKKISPFTYISLLMEEQFYIDFQFIM